MTAAITEDVGKNQRKAAADRDPRWATVLAREVNASFFYSVKTTGVYCRPSCAARRPSPENVAFHATCGDAEKAGFRPCRRCKPNQQSLQELHALMMVRICRRIERSEQVPTLGQLAGWAGMSLSHFHRAFKAATGLTPRQYAAAHRTNRVRATLERSNTVTNAIYKAGYNSGGRFYETSTAVLGMTPSAYRAGGKGTDISFAIGECSLGSILVAHSGRGVCSILIGDDPAKLLRDLQDRFPKASLIGDDSQFAELVANVIALVEAPGRASNLPLDIQGTAFQQLVWKALQRIPAGTTATYSEIANAIGKPTSVRAVAQACAANSLAVVIPCHRVIRSDGGLSGYRWGAERKRALLDKEANQEANQQANQQANDGPLPVT